MKQCPNPNCILYTRLEELPDAYVKCPGCGGMLVDAPATSAASGMIGQQPRSGRPSTVTIADDDTLGHVPHVPQYPTHYVPAQAPAEEGYVDQYGYAYEQEEAGEDPYAYTQPPRSRLSNATRGAFVAGTLLLVLACAFVGLAFISRLGPQARVITGPQATETAVAALRPFVNTPIPILPTIPASSLPEATPTQLPPDPGGPQPTPVPQPTVAVPPPQPPQAPPPQSEPVVIIGAQMSVRIEGGQPVGYATAYKPDDPFNLAVQATFGPGNVTSITTRWYGPGGALFYELRREYTQPGAYWVGFTVRKDTPWEVGDYRVDIHTNDSAPVAGRLEFSVIP